MTPKEKKERIAYLWFRMKLICIISFYFTRLKRNVLKKEMAKFNKKGNKVMFEQVYDDDDHTCKEKLIVSVKQFWYNFMSFWLWFNMVTTPFVLLWPDLSLETEDYNMWLVLWINELCWFLDMIRKFFDKPPRSLANDTYEVAVAYIKSDLIKDVLALLPQLLTALDPKFAVFKLIRIYQYMWLHYPLESFIKLVLHKRE